MLKKRSLVAVILILTITLPAAISAAALSNWVRYDTTTTKNGFPGITALSMIQDSYGNIWFGTNSGAAKFSRNSVWTVYDETNGFEVSSTFDILEDKSHNFWFGSNGGGVTKMSSDEKTFTNYTTATSALVNNYVTRLLEDNNGSIWCGTSGGGISVFNPITSLWTEFTDKSGLPGKNIQDLLLDNDGNVWVATQYGVAVFYSTSKTWETLLPINTFSLAQDDSGKIWMGTSTDGIHVLNPGKNTWIHYDSTCGFQGKAVRDITVDNNGNIWAACYSSGVFFYNVRTGKWKSYTSANCGLLTDNCRGIMIDSDGFFWFSIQTKGVQKAQYYPYTIDGSNVVIFKGIQTGVTARRSFSISVDLPVTLSNGESWFDVSNKNILGDSVISYVHPLSCFSNSDPVYKGRSGNVNILNEAGERITFIYVFQFSLFKFSSDTIYVDSTSNSTKTITVKSDTSWRLSVATRDDFWISVNRTSGDTSQTNLTVTTLLANSGEDRSGYLVFTAAGVSDTVLVIQKGSGGITSKKDKQVRPLNENVYFFTSSSNSLAYNLPKASAVSLNIYNLNGTMVASSTHSIQAAGRYEVKSIISSLAAGKYICRFTAGSFSSQKMLHIIR